MTTTVYFDLDGTLLSYSTPFAELFAQTLPTEATDKMSETYSKEVLSSITALEKRPYQRAFTGVRKKYNLNVDRLVSFLDYFSQSQRYTTFDRVSVPRSTRTGLCVGRTDQIARDRPNRVH